MFTRFLNTELKNMASQYPVVTLLGPRQSGKTTLVKQCFSSYQYRNLEEPETLAFAKADPKAFLDDIKEGMIIDEIQRAPELLSYIQIIVDEQTQKKGFFILTGSHQLSLHAAVTQSLAGRTALLTLLPLSLAELKQSSLSLNLNELVLYGGYPRIFQDQLEPFKAHRNYLQTYVERDVRQLIRLKDLTLFQQFIKLCAGRIGQVFHFEALGNELGVSGKTVKEWVSILEASFIIFKLPPYFENLGKRTLKTPKLYFTDTGLASYLLGIENSTQLERDPLRGHLIENLFILEMIKHRYNLGLDSNMYYYRDNHQHEIDVIFKQGHDLIPIEIKSSKTFHPYFLKGLDYFSNVAGKRCPYGYLIYTGDHEQKIHDWQILNFQHINDIFERDLLS